MPSHTRTHITWIFLYFPWIGNWVLILYRYLSLWIEKPSLFQNFNIGVWLISSWRLSAYMNLLMQTVWVCMCVKRNLGDVSLTRAKLQQPETSRTAISLDVLSCGEHFGVYFADNLIVSVHFPCLLGRDVDNNFSLHTPHLSPLLTACSLCNFWGQLTEGKFKKRPTDWEMLCPQAQWWGSLCWLFLGT